MLNGKIKKIFIITLPQTIPKCEVQQSVFMAISLLPVRFMVMDLKHVQPNLS